MALNPPSWATDWQAAVLAVDGRLSPELERLVRTDEVLDAITVMHSLRRLIGRAEGGVVIGAGEADALHRRRRCRTTGGSVGSQPDQPQLHLGSSARRQLRRAPARRRL